jgi:carbon storage regulator CsrA
MLVLTRKSGEKVDIGGGVTVTIVEVEGNHVRVGIDAPDQFDILRSGRASWEDEPVESGELAFVCEW